VDRKQNIIPTSGVAYISITAATGRKMTSSDPIRSKTTTSHFLIIPIFG
jgi:hypothetical protein